MLLGAVLLALVQLAAGCAGNPQVRSVAQEAQVTVAHDEEPTSYNAHQPGEEALRNLVVTNQVLRGFWRYGADGEPVPDEEFGTVEQVAGAPLTLRYRIAEPAVWSDGEPLDCDDLVLAWAAGSGLLAAPGGDGPTGRSPYAAMAPPACDDGSREATVTYSQPSADWGAAFGPGSVLPAHVLERESGVPDLLAAVRTGDTASLEAAGRFLAHGWQLDPEELDLTRLPSSGPYQLADWQGGQSLTLTANRRWWGTPARIPVVVLRYIEGSQQVEALAGGQVQVAAPPAGPEVLEALRTLRPGVTVERGALQALEHLDLDLGGAFADVELRRALAWCVPRSAMAQAVAGPVDPDARVLGSRQRLPFQPGYAELVAGAHAGAYDQVDVDRARAVLQAREALGTVVRIGYREPDPRRAEEVAMIRESCSRAGFDVQDAGSEGFDPAELAEGAVDAALLSSPVPLRVAELTSSYATGGRGNHGGYSSPVVDDLASQLLRTADPAARLALLTQVEQELWRDLPTLPLWAVPGVAAWSDEVRGVALQPGAAGITWNAEQWVLVPR